MQKSSLMRIGVLIETSFDSYQMKLISGVRQEAKKHNLQVHVFDCNPADQSTITIHLLQTSVDLIKKSNLQAIIVATGSFLSKTTEIDFKTLFSDLDIPIVSVNIALAAIPSIIIDNEAGTRKIIEHFILEHKKKNIAYIAGPNHNDEALIRTETYKNTLDLHNIPFNEKL